MYSFFTEIGSRYIIQTYNVRAMILSNAWWSVNSFFYLFFFLSLIKNTRKKKYIIGLIVVLGIYSTISVLFFKDIRKNYFVDSWILGQLFVIASIMFYYSELLLSDSILNIKYSREECKTCQTLSFKRSNCLFSSTGAKSLRMRSVLFNNKPS